MSGDVVTFNEFEALDTPAVVVDVDVVQANIQTLQAYCDAHGFNNRPHVKSHKSSAIAQLQLDAEAIGICCQTVGEAEVMVEAGIDDILIPCPILGRPKLRRLNNRLRRGRFAISGSLSSSGKASRCSIGPLTRMS